LCFTLLAIAALSAQAAAEPIGLASDSAEEGRIPPPPYTLSIAPNARVLYGSNSELIYSSGALISRLDWPLEPAALLGQSLSLATSLGLELSIDYASALSAASGQVEDSDYLNGDGVRTHYSRHEGYLERAQAIDALVGWALALTPSIVLHPFALIEVLDFFWTGRDGYYQYPPETQAPYTPWSPEVPRHEVRGVVISYSQLFLAPALGLGLELRPSRAISASASIAASPLAMAKTVDSHFLRYLAFSDSIRGSWFLRPEVGASLALGRKLRCSLSLSYTWIGGDGSGETMIDDALSGASYLLSSSDGCDARAAFFSGRATLQVAL
jgi:Outer membrane protease